MYKLLIIRERIIIAIHLSKCVKDANIKARKYIEEKMAK